jgi:hypothetical protein
MNHVFLDENLRPQVAMTFNRRGGVGHKDYPGLRVAHAAGAHLTKSDFRGAKIGERDETDVPANCRWAADYGIV